jgi:hypothetical protein
METTLVSRESLKATVLWRFGFESFFLEVLQMPMTKIRWVRIWIKGKRDCNHCGHKWTLLDIDKTNIKTMIWMFKKSMWSIR